MTGNVSPGDWEIVGVVEDTVYQSVYWKDQTMYFLPLMQRPPSEGSDQGGYVPVRRGELNPDLDPMNNMEALARQTLASINPNMTVVNFQTFDEQISGNFVEER